MEHDVIIVVMVRGEKRYVGLDRKRAKLIFVEDRLAARRFDPGTACVACEVIRARMTTQSISLEDA